MVGVDLEDKAKVVASKLGDRILAALADLVSVFLKQTVEFNRLFNHLFQKDQGKTASAARILSPNPTLRPLPCLLIKSFFYGTYICMETITVIKWFMFGG